MNNSSMPERDLGEVIAIAASLTDRNLREQALHANVMGDALPSPAAFPVEVQRSMQIGATAMMLSRIENPSAPFNIEEFVGTLVDEETIRNLVIAFDQEPDEATIDYLQTMIRSAVATAARHFMIDQIAQNDIQATLEAADEVAHAHGVTTDKVFSSDVLYGDYMRQRYTAQSYVEYNVEQGLKINQQLMIDMITTIAESQFRWELERGQITPEEFEIVKAELTSEVLEDRKTVTEIESTINQSRKGLAFVLKRNVERFWGKSEVPACVPILGKLASQGEKKEPLKGVFLQMQMKNDLIAVICMEKGWDPSALTIEQSRRLYAHPQMKKFLEDERKSE